MAIGQSFVEHGPNFAIKQELQYSGETLGPCRVDAVHACPRRGQKHQRREKQAQVLDAQGQLAAESVEAVLGDDDVPPPPACLSAASAPTPTAAAPFYENIAHPTGDPTPAGEQAPGAAAPSLGTALIAKIAALAAVVTGSGAKPVAGVKTAASAAGAAALRPSSAPATPTARRFVPVKPRSVFAAAAAAQGNAAKPAEAVEGPMGEISGSAAPGAAAGEPDQAPGSGGGEHAAPPEAALEGFDGPRTISSVFANIAGAAVGAGASDEEADKAADGACKRLHGAAAPPQHALSKLKARHRAVMRYLGQAVRPKPTCLTFLVTRLGLTAVCACSRCASARTMAASRAAGGPATATRRARSARRCTPAAAASAWPRSTSAPSAASSPPARPTWRRARGCLAAFPSSHSGRMVFAKLRQRCRAWQPVAGAKMGSPPPRPQEDCMHFL